MVERKDSLLKNFIILTSSSFDCKLVLYLCSNPSLRVAYIDEVEEREGGKNQKVYYSVLVKAVENLDQVGIVFCSRFNPINLVWDLELIQ